MKTLARFLLTTLFLLATIALASCASEPPSTPAPTPEPTHLQSDGRVVTHPATGAMTDINGATAHLIRSDEGVSVQMNAIDLEPGYVYTAWWVIANNPEACEADPCSGGDFLGKQEDAKTVVTYADGVVVDASGTASFSSYLPTGKVTNDPWFAHDFTNPGGSEIHLIINSHGPMIPDQVGEMINSFRAGCTEESVSPPFPDTALADGAAGPNTCALVQAAIFQ